MGTICLYYKGKHKHSKQDVQILIGCRRTALMASFLENYCIFVGNLEADVDGGLWTTFSKPIQINRLCYKVLERIWIYIVF